MSSFSHGLVSYLNPEVVIYSLIAFSDIPCVFFFTHGIQIYENIITKINHQRNYYPDR
jgi:hypothetical protein